MKRLKVTRQAQPWPHGSWEVPQMCHIPTAHNTHWHLFQTEERNSHETQLLKKYKKRSESSEVKNFNFNKHLFTNYENKKSGILQSSFHFLKWSNGFEVSQYIHFLFVFDGVLLCMWDFKYTAIFLPQPPRYTDSTNELPWKFWYRILVTVIKTLLPQWNKTRYWIAETRQVSSNTLLSMFTIHWKIRMSEFSPQ